MKLCAKRLTKLMTENEHRKFNFCMYDADIRQNAIKGIGIVTIYILHTSVDVECRAIIQNALTNFTRL